MLMSQIIMTSMPEIARRSKIFSNTNREKQICIYKKYTQNLDIERSASCFPINEINSIRKLSRISTKYIINED